ncbi:hypothetical protein nbrc107696_40870 [Gordonia spumicola]|uniref:Uncharacterized protein n=2 Tax=Gordonia spumicola TaxID=589161 RepID=A0A7I9VEQ3_9ACTN|nr:hypothetical protein nbrc107696_40870 [Gordonia spumicola]
MSGAAVMMTVLACGSGDEGTATTAASPASLCDGAATAGPVAVPTDDVTMAAGEAHFTTTLDDGTTTCVSVTPRPGSEPGEWDVSSDEREFEFNSGDAKAGLIVTIKDDSDDTDDDFPSTLPGVFPDAFVGIQTNGVYFPDGFHTQCTVTVTALSADLVSAGFRCADIEAMTDGPFTENAPATPSTAKKLVKAEGWFVARKN